MALWNRVSALPQSKSDSQPLYSSPSQGWKMALESLVKRVTPHLPTPKGFWSPSSSGASSATDVSPLSDESSSAVTSEVLSSGSSSSFSASPSSGPFLPVDLVSPCLQYPATFDDFKGSRAPGAHLEKGNRIDRATRVFGCEASYQAKALGYLASTYIGGAIMERESWRSIFGTLCNPRIPPACLKQIALNVAAVLDRHDDASCGTGDLHVNPTVNVVSALCYLERLLPFALVDAAAFSDGGNGVELATNIFTLCLYLAFKHNYEYTLRSSRWAYGMGISVRELARLEITAFQLLDYRLELSMVWRQKLEDMLTDVRATITSQGHSEEELWMYRFAQHKLQVELNKAPPSKARPCGPDTSLDCLSRQAALFIDLKTQLEEILEPTACPATRREPVPEPAAWDPSQDPVVVEVKRFVNAPWQEVPPADALPDHTGPTTCNSSPASWYDAPPASALPDPVTPPTRTTAVAPWCDAPPASALPSPIEPPMLMKPTTTVGSWYNAPPASALPAPWDNPYGRILATPVWCAALPASALPVPSLEATDPAYWPSFK